MSRTFKHTLARAFHKRCKALLATSWAAWSDAIKEFPIAARRVTRYGVKRRYEAGRKVLSRRSDRAKLKQADRQEQRDS